MLVRNARKTKLVSAINRALRGVSKDKKKKKHHAFAKMRDALQVSCSKNRTCGTSNVHSIFEKGPTTPQVHSDAEQNCDMHELMR